MSEYLFLVMFFLALRLHLGGCQDRRRRGMLGLASGVLFSGATYVRTACLVVVPGMLAGARGRKTLLDKIVAVAPAALVVILALPWFWFASKNAATATNPATQLRNFSYTTALLHVDSGDPSSPYLGPDAWLARIGQNAGRLIQSFGVSLVHTPSFWAGVAAGLCVLAGFTRLTVRRGWSLIEWYTTTYLLLILAYFAYAHRLVLPLVPFFYGYLFFGVGCLGRLAGKERAGRIGITLQCLLFALLLGSNLAFFMQNTEVSAAERSARKTEYRAAEWLRDHTAWDARVLYDFAPSLSVLCERRVYSYQFLRRHSLIPQVEFAVFTGQENRLESRLKERASESWVLAEDDEHTETRIYRVDLPADLRTGF
jgi:hypothetical protein